MSSYEGRQGNQQGQMHSSRPQTTAQSSETVVYYDADGNIDKKWVDEKALDVVNALTPERDPRTKKAKKNNKSNINSAQLRRFYSEVKTLERIWITRGQTNEAFAALLPQIKILKAKAAYAKGREVAPQYFQTWMSAHVNAVNSPKDFEAFLLHFEAVIGFSKQYLAD